MKWIAIISSLAAAGCFAGAHRAIVQKSGIEGCYRLKSAVPLGYRRDPITRKFEPDTTTIIVLDTTSVVPKYIQRTTGAEKVARSRFIDRNETWAWDEPGFSIWRRQGRDSLLVHLGNALSGHTFEFAVTADSLVGNHYVSTDIGGDHYRGIKGLPMKCPRS